MKFLRLLNLILIPAFGLLHTQKIAAFNNENIHRIDNFRGINGESNMKKGSALHFDGIDDYVEIPVNQCITPREITVELWAKSDTELWNSMGALISLRDNYIMHPEVATKTIQFYIIKEKYHFVETTLDIDLTKWHHYAGTYDGSTLKLYVDGALLVAGNNKQVKSTHTHTNLRIGSDTYDDARFFRGAIDEVRIWNYARTQKNIQRTMHLELLGNELGLVAYYNFNQGSIEANNHTEQTLLDGTGKNNGKLHNFKLHGTTSNWIESGVPIFGKNNGTDFTTNYITAKNIVLLFFLFAIIIAGFFWRNKQQLRIQKRLENEVAQKTKELVAENKIKDALISEIHHRVKNNLQSISSFIYFQIKTIEGQHNKTGLINIQQRIDSMAAIHEMLYSNDDLSMISAKEFINSLLRYLVNLHSKNGEFVTTEIEAADKKIDISKAITLGLLLSEIITNALKHAFDQTEKPHIKISFENINHNFYLTISDNGCGIMENEPMNANGKSLGLKLIDIFARQLNANVTTKNIPGLTYQFEFEEL